MWEKCENNIEAEGKPISECFSYSCNISCNISFNSGPIRVINIDLHIDISLILLI